MIPWPPPKISCTQTVLPHPVDTDPIIECSHGGNHVLLYDSAVHKSRISYGNTVQEQCDWLNTDKNIWGNLARIASVVKLHVYVKSIQETGVVKPMLLAYTGEKLYAHCGKNRMRASELLPELVYFESFITTHKDHAHQFDLPKIENFEQFTDILKTPIGSKFEFTHSHKGSKIGIYEYKYESNLTPAHPTMEWCERVMRNYLEQNTVIFTPHWFTKEIDWNQYA